MYTKEELHDMQARIDMKDAKRRPDTTMYSGLPSKKRWDPDLGEVSVTTPIEKVEKIEKSNVPKIYSNGLQYYYAMKPKKQNKNYVVYAHKNPYDFEDIKVVNWQGKWFKENLMGWRRDPAMIFENFEKATKVVSGEPRDFIAVTKAMKTEEDRDLNIYFEYNKGNISLDEVLDKFQVDIINGYDNESIHLSGPAGTGKSVVAGKIYEGLDSKVAIVPNENVKKDFEGDNTFTYAEYSEILENGVTTYINEFIEKLNIPQSMIIDQKIDISINTKLQFNWLNEFGKQLLFENNNFILDLKNMSSIESEFLKAIPQKSINDLYEFDLKLQNIIDLAGDIDREYPEEDIDNISRNIIRDFYDVSKIEKFIVFDEAPLLCKYPLILAMSYYANRIGKKFILTYDIAQHKHKDIVRVKDVIDIEDAYKLNIVFRTTKEIFDTAIEYMDEDFDFKAPISVENSVSHTIEPKYERVIKFSDVIRDVNSIIGAEYDDLSIKIDVPIIKSNYHLYYILCTRAIKNLNFVKTRYR